MEWDGILANLPLDIRTFIFTRYRGRGRRRKFPPLSDILSISRGIFKWPEQQQVVNPFFKGFSLGTGSVRGREGEGNSYGTVPPSLPPSLFSIQSTVFQSRAIPIPWTIFPEPPMRGKDCPSPSRSFEQDAPSFATPQLCSREGNPS